jgi:pimeloyl-ACP methyl ester carboxylesterase
MAPRKPAAGALVLALTLLISGCAMYRPTAVPMDMISDRGGCAPRATELVVMLPGARSSPDEFVDEGFVAALRRRGLPADVTMVDSHMGYYTNESMLQRLRDDVVLPARTAGYRRIWLVGISLGGFTALGYAARYGGDIDGVLALAPYPGSEKLLAEMATAGGPAAWQHSVQVKPNDFERAIWLWLARGGGAGKLPVYLGHGLGDRFAGGLRVMTPLLPAGHASTVPGGHDWEPWRQLWDAWLERGLLARGCTAAGPGQG